MYSEPQDLDRDVLLRTLRGAWGLSVSELRYEPVGFGTHHYVTDEDDGTSWFINVDELAAKTWISSDPGPAFEGLKWSLRAALALRSAGLEFVHAPTPARDGSVVVQVDDRYAASAYAFVEGTPVGAYGQFTNERDRQWVLGALARMHEATVPIPSGAVVHYGLELPLRGRLVDALAELSTEWVGGPFSESVRHLLIRCADDLRDAFQRFDVLDRSVRTDGRPRVVTHGEPHAANVMQTADGRMLLIDWDTVALAPPERDLWHVSGSSDADWNAYIASGGPSDVNPDAIALYRLWWALSEVTGYVDALRAKHEENADSQEAWKNLQDYASEIMG